MDEHTRRHLKESPWVVVLPLVLLAIPSIVAGALFMEPMLFGGYFGESIRVLPEHDVLGHMAEEYHDKTGLALLVAFVAHAMKPGPLWLAVGGIVAAWYLYLERPDLPAAFARRLRPMYRVLKHKYGFDEFNQFVFAGGARSIGRFLWRFGDMRVIDGVLVNGTAHTIGWFSRIVRHVQSGYVYHYAFAMIIGLFLLLTFFLKPSLLKTIL